MLITFHSKAAADVLMRVTDAQPLLHFTGKSPDGQVAERGVYAPEQLADAIAALESAIAAQPEAPDLDEHSPDAPHPIDRKVSLRQRAFPLLDMLRKARAGGVAVVWETSRGW